MTLAVAGYSHPYKWVPPCPDIRTGAGFQESGEWAETAEHWEQPGVRAAAAVQGPVEWAETAERRVRLAAQIEVGRVWQEPGATAGTGGHREWFVVQAAGFQAAVEVESLAQELPGVPSHS